MSRQGYERIVDEDEENDLGSGSKQVGSPALCFKDCVQPDLYLCCHGCCWNCGRTYRAGWEGFFTLKFLSVTCGPESNFHLRSASIVLFFLWLPTLMLLAAVEGVLALLWILFVDILWRFTYMLAIFLFNCSTPSCFSCTNGKAAVNQEGLSYLPCFESLARDPGTEVRCHLQPDFLC